MKLKVNQWAGIVDIINCVLFAFIILSWFINYTPPMSDSLTYDIFTMLTWICVYLMTLAGIVLNIIALIRTEKMNLPLTGPILGIIGSALYVLTSFFVLPALVLLIIAAIFTLKQTTVKENKKIN